MYQKCVFLVVVCLALSACAEVERCAQQTLNCVLANYDDDEYHDLQSVVVIKRGNVLAERYFNGSDSNRLVDVRSAGKSVTSLLFGIAMDKGFIGRLDQQVADILDAAKNTDLGRVPFEHLLTMRTGLDADANDPNSIGMEDHMDASSDPFAFVLTVPLIEEGGQRYVYNSLAAYAAGLVIGTATGDGLEAFASEHLFKPLAFKQWNWQEDRSGYTKGQGNLFLTAPDFAKIGLMVLNQGQYDGQRIVSSTWIEESLKRRVDVSAIEPNAIGYGYYWFYQEYEMDSKKLGVHFASGNGGNKIYIIPALDMVVSVMSTAYGQGRGHRRSEAILKDVLAFELSLTDKT